MEKSVLLVLGTLVPFVLALGITHRSWIRRKSNLLDWDKHFLLALACCLLLALGTAGYGALAAFPETWIYECLDAVFSLLEGDSEAFRSLTPHTPMLSKWLPVLTPLLAAGTVLVLLWNHLPHHIPIGYRVWYVFSELEPHSIHLANSLKDENALCIFMRTRRQNVSHELLEQLESINYWFYPKTETSLLRLPWRRGKCLRFFFLSENTDENFRRMDQFLQDIKKYRLFSPKKDGWAENQFQQELYLLSETESAPMLIDRLRFTMMDGKERLPVFRNTECRLLDRNRAISYALLRKKPLYNYCSDDRTNILVLGFGRIGREFFRAASSIGIMPHRMLEFTLCDLRIKVRWAALMQQCPEIHQPNVITKALNAESAALEGLVNSKQFHYIVVALGDDEVNIRVATWLKRHYRLRHWQNDTSYQPQICVNIEDEIKSDYIKKLWKKEYSWDLDLHVFGTMPEIFSAETLLPRQLWAAAAYVHGEIIGKDTKNWGEYERRSSLACAMHGIYHAESKTYIADDQKDELIGAEHHRWMAYVRSEGMRLASEEMVSKYAKEIHNHVDVKGRLTPCLIEGKESLKNLYARLGQVKEIKSLGDVPFWDRDEKVVDGAGEIVTQVNSLNRYCDYDAIVHYKSGTFARRYADSLNGKVVPTKQERLTHEQRMSFLNGHYETFVTTQPIVAYRLYGKYAIDRRKPSKSGARLGGRYVSTEFAESMIDARMRLALDPKWKNTRMYEAKLIIPKGTTISVGIVAPVVLPTGTVLPGGAPQIMLPHSWSKKWICGYRRVSARQLQIEPTYRKKKPRETAVGKGALFPDICPRCCFEGVAILPPHEQIQIVGSKGRHYTLNKKCLNPDCRYHW